MPDTLSTNAVRVLAALVTERDAALRASATCSSYQQRPPTRLTDSRLAARCTLPHREIIEAARELIAAGYLVLASCDSRNPGRWLGTIEEAREYERSLGRRGKRVLMGRRDLRRAIRLAELNQSPDDRGQLALFTPQEARP